MSLGQIVRCAMCRVLFLVMCAVSLMLMPMLKLSEILRF